MRITAKLAKAFFYMATCFVCINCGGEFNPASPSPVVTSEVGPNGVASLSSSVFPSHDIGPVGDIGPSGDVGPSGGIGPVDGPCNPVRNNNFYARDFIHSEMFVLGQSQLRLEAVNGAIHLTGSQEADRIVIMAERLVRSESTEDAQRHLQVLEVRILDLGNEIWVKTVQPEETWGRDYMVNYTISLPRHLEVSVDSINGHVGLQEIFASTFVELVNGRIEGNIILPRAGMVDLSTVNGAIDLHIPVDTSAEFAARVSNGNIRVSNLTLREEIRDWFSLRGTLGNGDGRISLRTVNGPIRLSGF